MNPSPSHVLFWLYFNLTVLCVPVCVCLCVSLPPVAEHCGLSQPVRADRNEPRRSVSRMFLLRGEGEVKKKETQFPLQRDHHTRLISPARKAQRRAVHRFIWPQPFIKYISLPVRQKAMSRSGASVRIRAFPEKTTVCLPSPWRVYSLRKCACTVSMQKLVFKGKWPR